MSYIFCFNNNTFATTSNRRGGKHHITRREPAMWASAAFEKMKTFYALLEEEELETQVLGGDTACGPLSPATGITLPAMASRYSSDPLELPDEGAPRRTTHDGQMRTVSADSPLLPSGFESRAVPHSEPARQRKVRWAPGVESPKLTRELMHRRARDLTMMGSVTSGSAVCRSSSTTGAGTSVHIATGTSPSSKRQKRAAGRPRRLNEYE